VGSTEQELGPCVTGKQIPSAEARDGGIFSSRRGLSLYRKRARVLEVLGKALVETTGTQIRSPGGGRQELGSSGSSEMITFSDSVYWQEIRRANFKPVSRTRLGATTSFRRRRKNRRSCQKKGGRNALGKDIQLIKVSGNFSTMPSESGGEEESRSS